MNLTVGNSTNVTVSNASGTVSVSSSNTNIATAAYTRVNSTSGFVAITGKAAGSATVTVRDNTGSKTIAVTVINSGTGGGGGGTSSTGYSLMAWNDLGMHCMDKDFSVFSVLPPYNNLHAQLVNKATGKKVVSGVTLTYEAMADNTGTQATNPTWGSINTSSATKTNFWTYVKSLFGGQPAPNYGLNLNDPLVSNRTPGTTPIQMQQLGDMFVAEGLPITPNDDAGKKNFYPMVKVTAKNTATGAVLATARAVLPVSDEMTCIACHASRTTGNTAQMAAKPTTGWVFNADAEKDYKLNILKLHDQKQFGNSSNATLYANALSAVGYLSGGLYTTATTKQPITCAACHSSNALKAPGVTGVRPMTAAQHSGHANVVDPSTITTAKPAGSTLNAATNIAACYMCHPGSQTQCVRGAMIQATDAAGNPAISCQNCHGNMAAVGNLARTGWLSEPTCQACHQNGTRLTMGVDANGLPKTTTDTRFATNPNTPLAGFSLYRFSTGHGGLQCEACHGATHAEYPTTHSQDNAQSIDLQGHAGTVAECTACHNTVPTTVTGGPHGMHTTGQAWVSGHESAAKANRTQCTACHGTDYRGSPLSEVKVAKTFSVEGSTKTFPANHAISCYDCHNGPNP